ncbi:hypothetical protein PTT_13455 [Pyrenophora teres f. teres 0-1]|uniref:Uncharacterized protein n=1 Tax=Pyrenophora teres f. teres (strain 0-1) TaxID=861557 RepID=E3RW53_PYRTT|nr:hypothetical protein PTT_13455 [Pyrenophora teres f. teres 0-1]
MIDQYTVSSENADLISGAARQYCSSLLATEHHLGFLQDKLHPHLHGLDTGELQRRRLVVTGLYIIGCTLFLTQDLTIGEKADCQLDPNHKDFFEKVTQQPYDEWLEQLLTAVEIARTLA